MNRFFEKNKCITAYWLGASSASLLVSTFPPLLGFGLLVVFLIPLMAAACIFYEDTPEHGIADLRCAAGCAVGLIAGLCTYGLTRLTGEKILSPSYFKIWLSLLVVASITLEPCISRIRLDNYNNGPL